MAENTREGVEEKVKIVRSDVAISSALAIAIQRAWAKVILQTKYPAKVEMGDDGTTLQLGVFVRFQGIVQGEIWEPRTGLPKTLYDLGHELISIAKSGKKLSSVKEAKLIAKLKALETQSSKP